MAKEPEPYPLEEITRRHAALRLAREAEHAIQSGARVTRVTPAMVAEFHDHWQTIHKIRPESRARAAKAGGIARAEQARAERRLRAEGLLP
jgi:hypothetical protein